LVAGEFVEEDPADAPHLPAMRQGEVVVAPLLEARIERGIVRVAGGAQRAVEVADVLLPRIEGREIRAAAEPAVLAPGEEAEVRVDGGDVGAPGMQDQRDTRGVELRAVALHL